MTYTFFKSGTHGYVFHITLTFNAWGPRERSYIYLNKPATESSRFV